MMTQSTTKPNQERSSSSTNEQAKADFKAKSALVHQPKGQATIPVPERKKPEPIKLPEIELPQINLSIFGGQSLLDTAAVASALLTVAVWGIPPVNTVFRKSVQWTSPVANYIGENFGDYGHTPKVGDKINGYAVTSGYGKRDAPCAGCSTNHPAIDIATPIGTQIYIPETLGAPVEVKCRQPAETGGGGLVAEVLIPSRGVIYQALHLSDCQSGKVNGGTIFARTGDSGIGTGAHLDLRKARTEATAIANVSKPLQYEPITAYESEWILRGVPPKLNAPEM